MLCLWYFDSRWERDLGSYNSLNILVFNQDWFVEEWRALGHRVITVGHSRHLDVVLQHFFLDIHQVLELLPQDFVPDWVVFHDNSSPLDITGLEDCRIPLAFYSVDAHHHCLLHSRLAYTFDVIFLAQKDYISHFENRRAVVEWLPLWASREVAPSSEKKYGAVFVGTMRPELNPERVAFFEALKQQVPIEIFEGAYWLYFPHGEIVVNQTVRSDLNFRVFEAMMCGPLLLTERTENGLLDIFERDTDLIVYEKGGVEQAASLIRQCLGNLQRTREIALRGRQKVLQFHRAVHRAKTVLNVLETVPRSSSPRSIFAQLMNYVVWAKNAGDAGNFFAISGYAVALKKLMLALERGETLDEEAAFFAVMACLGFDRVMAKESGRKVLGLLADRFPQLKTLGIGQLVAMSQRGEQELLERVLSSVGLPAVEFLTQIFPVE